MARLPFDPARIIGPQVPAKTPAHKERQLLAHTGEAAQLTVSQVADLIKNTLEQRVPGPLRVVGQVSNLSCNNHWYFSLKDEQAVLHCVAWASSARKFGFMPKQGDEVVVTGAVSHYLPQGRTQLYVTQLQPVGAGALDLKFRAMCDELRGLGYFDEARKKPLPAFPRRIAVITSKTGAAIHDVLDTARRRCCAVCLLIVDVRVQGDGAARQIARAIAHVDRHRQKLGVDAILVTRGGGSMEDLWAFNERVVADAAFRCRLPLVAAIGHESDTTVIELVADVRAATPTQAVMRLIPARSELAQQAQHLEHRLALLLRRAIEQSRQRLRFIAQHEAFRQPELVVRRAGDKVASLRRGLLHALSMRVASQRAAIENLAGRLAEARPQELTARRRERLAVLDDRLSRAVTRHARVLAEKISSLDRQLSCIDPHSVLSRGYSYTTDAAGRLVRSVADVRAGQAMVTRVSDGSIDSVAGKVRGRIDRAGAAAKEHAAAANQLDLFSPSR
jgi:exodeoxyribonuclease VII large subunit